MIDPAVKTAVAVCVLLVGTCAALLFRHDRSRLPAPDVRVDEELLLRARAEAPGPRTGKVVRSVGDTPGRQATPAEARPATVVTPLDRRESPPSLSPEYPDTGRPASSRWGASMEMMLPMAAPTDETARTHTVVDGDTLPALAERYLGSSALADDIYQANRELLRDPKLLPIGLELKLPPRGGRSAPQGVLTPVR